jgi:tetratricopeptide (TPR) repeat protein
MGVSESDQTEGGEETLPQHGLEVREPPPDEWVQRGTQIGRYLVLRTIGSGGMGMVFLADDPELGREIAIKLLRPDRNHPGGLEVARRRLMREAQAIAQLSHPNVVAVYDVGTFGSGVFIAMEYVEGKDLRLWLTKTKPSVDEILDVFIAAGRGLAAAHTAGIVHRDVKPDNILVGERVRMTDFGLARSVTETDQIPVEGGDDFRTSAEMFLEQEVTQVGLVMGTPAYMSPEQMQGKQGDPATDQFALCITLYEAICGTRPFPDAKERSVRRKAIRAGADVGRKAIPRALRPVLARGLSYRPGDRYPSMDALVAELERVRHRKRRYFTYATVAGVLALGVGLGSARALLEDDACADASAALDRLWTRERVAQLGASFETSPVPFAADTWTLVHASLDDFASRWRSIRQESCEATVVRHEQSGTEMDRVARCLDLRLEDFDATLAALEQADDDVVRNAVATVTALPRPESCTDPLTLATLPPLPDDPSVQRSAQALRAQLAGARANRAAGRYAQTLEQLQALSTAVERLDYAPVLAEYALELGRTHAALEQHDPAEKQLRAALAAAERGRHEPARAEIWLALAHELGPRQKRFGAAEEALAAANAIIEALGRPPAMVGRATMLDGDIAYARDELLEAQAIWEPLLDDADGAGIERDELLHKLGRAANDWDTARERFDAALALREVKYGAKHPKVADTLVAMATPLMQQREYDAADAALERALAIREPVFGERSPPVAEVRSRLGVVDIKRGRYDDAIEHLEWAVQVLDEHPQTVEFDAASIATNLGVVYGRVKRLEDARRMHLHALNTIERTAGPDHPRVVVPLINLASVHGREGDPEGALEWQRRVVDIICKLPDKQARCADMLVEQGDLYLEMRDLDAADKRFRRAIELYERTNGPGSGSHGEFALARSMVERGEIDAAIELMERTVEKASNGYPETRGERRFRLARLRWEERRDRARAIELAEAAREDYVEYGEPGEAHVKTIDAWLAERR